MNRRLHAALTVDRDTDSAAKTVATVKPPAQVPDSFMVAATRVVDPVLGTKAASVMHKDLRDYRERAARCLVKRVVAALCGVDDGLPVPEYNAEYARTRLDSFVVVSRDTLLQLRDALLTEPVIAALEQTAGPEATAEMLGLLSLLS